MFTYAKGNWWLELAPGERTDPDLVGDVVVQCEQEDQGITSLFIGRRPPPQPFKPDDLPQLRRGSDELKIIMGAVAVAHDQLGVTADALRAAIRSGVDLQLLVEVAESTNALRTWPAKAAPQLIAQFVDILRGVVDEPATFRLAATGRFDVTEGVPARSVRRFVSSEPWRSSRIAAAARGSAAELRKVFPELALADQLDTIAVAARPTHRRMDLPPSGWPWKFRRLWNVLLMLLNSQRAPGVGEHHLPLQRCWSLYQDWATLKLIQELSTILGPYVRGGVAGIGPKRARPLREAPLLGWSRNKLVVDLWVQPTIGARTSPRHLVDVYSADLVPDVLIVSRRGDELNWDGTAPPDALRTIVIDQKRYAGIRDDGVITAGDAAVNAGKYLWAMRRGDNVDSQALDHIVLISPGGGGRYAAAAKTTVVGARPGTVEALSECVRKTILSSLGI